jgi:type I restriction enzyme R subunit
MRELHFFDPNRDIAILERRLPHWSQPGVVCFITFRTADSFPKELLIRFQADRRHWLRCHKIDPDAANWREQLQKCEQEVQHDFFRTFSTRWHATLDRGAGECALANPTHSKIVFDSLLHFDGDRYEMTDFVVMPNHVHLLATFSDDDAMLAQCESWKHFTARDINRSTSREGRFWQQDGFDHLLRSVEQFEHLRRYIALNPRKAGLNRTQYLHYSK